MSLHLVSNRPPDVDPSKAWIAYGVVVDDDRDGVPDWRYGIDNLPRTAGDEDGHHREWRTNLHTGRTESVSGSDWASVSKTFLATGYPAEGGREGFRFNGDGARFRFGHVSDTTQGTNTQGVKVDMPFYAWASVIVDGRVVATDYAPDTGWLLPSPGANPGGTYVVGAGDGPPLRLSMSIPVGWSAAVPAGGRSQRGRRGRHRPRIHDHRRAREIACDRSGDPSEAHVGPSVDDLVTFLEGLQREVSKDGRRRSRSRRTPTSRSMAIAGNTSSTRRPSGTTTAAFPSGRRPRRRRQRVHPGCGSSTSMVFGLVIHASAPTARRPPRPSSRRIVESIEIGP